MLSSKRLSAGSFTYKAGALLVLSALGGGAMAVGCGSSSSGSSSSDGNGGSGGTSGSHATSGTGDSTNGSGGSGGMLFPFVSSSTATGQGTGTATGTAAGTGGATGTGAGTGTGGMAPVCDGNPTSGPATWSNIYGDTNDQQGSAIATDPSGNVYVTGFFKGTLTLGTLTAQVDANQNGGTGLFVAKFSPTGTPLWVVSSSSSTNYNGGALYPHYQGGHSIAVDPAGSVVVGGIFGGVLNLGGACSQITSYSNFFDDGFVAKLNAADGKCIWVQQATEAPGTAGDGGEQDVQGIAIDSTGNVLIGGHYEVNIQIGGMKVSGPQAASSAETAYVMKLNGTNGTAIWAHSYADDVKDAYIQSVAVDKNNDVIVGGRTAGPITFVTGQQLTPTGPQDGVIAKLSGATGEGIWSHIYGVDTTVIEGVATDSANNVLFTGEHRGDITFGGDTLPNQYSPNLFVVKLDASGNHVWSHSWGDTKAQEGHSIVVDSANQAVVAGEFTGVLDFSGQPLTATGPSGDAFLAKIDSHGCVVWAKTFGDGNLQQGFSVAVDASKNILLTGSLAGAANFGSGTLTSVGGSDVFLAKFGP